ncbi:MAG: hypothetical protein P4L95_10075 [Rouxiella aceris]|uniref:hypothetical protein n=1 Tax=Rouxiella aceris TaxID=2703884 RepID=UPI00284D6249|nr:hypothetical protein [Rouxiella aceris]MDR3432228.1 hypothetical protein [Rouxiella aceris]
MKFLITLIASAMMTLFAASAMATEVNSAATVAPAAHAQAYHRHHYRHHVHHRHHHRRAKHAIKAPAKGR